MTRAAARDADSEPLDSTLGGFDGTTNALAGHMCEVPLHGTMAHAFIQSFSDRSDLATTELVGPPPSKTRHDFLSLVLKLRDELGWTNTNEGELIAFIAYAQATRRPAPCAPAPPYVALPPLHPAVGRTWSSGVAQPPFWGDGRRPPQTENGAHQPNDGAPGGAPTIYTVDVQKCTCTLRPGFKKCW